MITYNDSLYNIFLNELEKEKHKKKIIFNEIKPEDRHTIKSICKDCLTKDYNIKCYIYCNFKNIDTEEQVNIEKINNAMYSCLKIKKKEQYLQYEKSWEYGEWIEVNSWQR